ncbi:MAG: sulfite oxidase-like oxidoreductase [Chloroflexi bacterium]|nr:sulfite oxidase-like oxidoreductase [Chloroflexota bacterium]
MVRLHQPREEADVGSKSDTRRLPPGQYLTDKFPVLTYGASPRIETKVWTFEVKGLVKQPVTLTWAEIHRLPLARVTSDFHCVTGWSRLDNVWEGVRVRDVLALAEPLPEARHVMAFCYGGYTTNLPLEAVTAENVLVAFLHDGRDLERDHGGPARLLVPSRYGYKSAKWVRGLELLAEEERGFWEVHGYHSNADPWTEERYSF